MSEPDPRRGMSHEIAERFNQLPKGMQEAYLRFWINRLDKHAAHRDTLEAFVAGWTMRGTVLRKGERRAA